MQQDFCVLMHWKLLLPPATKFAKVMFLHLSVSHSVHRGGSASRVSASTWVCIMGGVCIWGSASRGSAQGGLPRGVCIQAGFASNWGVSVSGVSASRGGVGILRDTVNERAVRVLLECILVIKTYRNNLP